MTHVDRIIQEHGRGPEATIPVLQAVQGCYGYLPQEALRRICQVSDITAASIAGVSTFYMQFRHRPVGRHVVRVCDGTACHVKGAELVRDAVFRELHIPPGTDTDPVGEFTVEKVACLGCCTLAPVVQIDEVTYGHLTPDTVARMLQDFLELRQRRAARPARRRTAPPDRPAEIRIGLGSCCVARGSAKVHQALSEAVDESGARAVIKQVGCVGMCHQTPLVEIVLPGGQAFLYARVQAEDAGAIVRRHFKPAGLVRRVALGASGVLENLLTDEAWEPVARYSLDVRDEPVVAFLGPQRRLATEHCGCIDPLDLDEYMRYDGFAALRKCLTGMTPEGIVAEITHSGLRGRGGAGYITGQKWAAVRSSTGGAPAGNPDGPDARCTKYLICNGDEGDPGAFMDRMILESYPYRVIEGMVIAAFAVGAREGVLYIRAEYPLAVRRVREALARCRQRNLLGANILGSGLDLELRIMEGAGAFVCGEETALLASIEGRRGMPRLRPPYPAENGLWGKPTLVNNVETYAQVPWIMRHGSAAFAAMGTTHSKGTKVFALAGKIARGGLIEVPMGVTLRQIVQDVGGGIAGGRRLKAVQVGGPSGGCVPAELADTPVDYEALTGVGAIMGSGGLVVMDESDCMVEMARYFLEFTQDQSCGKCTFCRVGTRRMLDVLDRLCTGHGQDGDLEELETLAASIKKGSLCGLGRTAPNPVLSTLKYFRHEYEAHLQKRCPAGRCKALIKYVVTDDCIGCTLCAQHCPVDAIPMLPYEKHEIDTTKCIRCDTCRGVCPVKAVRVE
jgi:NADH-quinone oxidoreductase subunit F